MPRCGRIELTVPRSIRASSRNALSREVDRCARARSVLQPLELHLCRDNLGPKALCVAAVTAATVVLQCQPKAG